MRDTMSDILPNNEPSESATVEEALSQEPSFLQKNKLVVSIVSAVLVIAVGVGGFVLTRPSPAQPYLDKVCAAFDGLKVSETSNNEAKALYSAQKSLLDQAQALDPEASTEVAAAMEQFSQYIDKVSTTNFQIALSMTLKDFTKLTELTAQIDRDSAIGKSAVTQMDAACGR